MNDFDVLVVGGGPAGSTTAALCAQRGLHVAIFDHARFPRHKVCGDVINPNCWPVLERSGAADKIRTLPRHDIHEALFTAGASEPARIPLPRGTVAISRTLFDQALLEHAGSCGVEVFENETVHEITAARQIVTRSGRFQAGKCIIGADGRHSVTARSAGLARRQFPRTDRIAVQGHFCAPENLNSGVQLHLFRGGYGGIVRVDDEHANLCIVTDRRGAQHRSDCEALFGHTLDQNPHFRAIGLEPRPLEPLQSVHPLQGPMNVPARNGVFLVGDALRVMEPFTGQGILFALRTAEIAADSICAPSRPEENYTKDVTRLYHRRGRTNARLHRLMYHADMARAVIPFVRGFPALAHWLSDNVLGEEPQFR
jgi:flavin-dependent dehydrogenase